MEEELELNTKLVGFCGVIGRRDYIINEILIIIISQIFTSVIIFGSVGSFDFNKSLFSQYTSYQVVLTIILWCICMPISFGNKMRRLSDIFGIKSNIMIYGAVSIILLLSMMTSFLALKYSWLLYVILFGVALFFMIKRGEVTCKIEKDPVKRFNWGAFAGTWIWGLFNKSYKTMYEIPLVLTSAGFLTFPLLCGMKGNEWA